MNTDLFQSSGHSPVLQIWLHIFVIVFITASSPSFIFSFTTRLSSLYSSSVYSLHLSFIPSSSPIIFPSFVLSEPILGAAVFVISFIFANISFVLPFFPSSSNSLHIHLGGFPCLLLLFFERFYLVLSPSPCFLSSLHITLKLFIN